MLKRFVLLLGGPLAALATVVAAIATAGDLPDPIATHWGAGGAPDGHTAPWAFAGGLLLLCLLAWGVLLLQARRRGPAGLRLTAAPAVWATIAFLCGVAVATIGANAGAASWREAGDVTLWTLLAVLGASALAGIAAWALERGRPVAPQRTVHAVAPIALADGEQAVWSRSLASRPAAIGCAAIGGGMAVAGLLVGGAAGWGLVAGGVATAVLLSALSEIVATVDARGLTIAYGPLGWPRQTVPLADVASAERTEIDPWSVGGWGYRKAGSGKTAVVLRGGEGLRVVRRDGRELLVTVPDAATAAGLLTALRGRAA